MKFFIQTFGCQMNENDSLLISELLSAAGYDQTDTPANADIIIVNTCCVRNSAEDRAFGYIGSLKKLYEQNRNLIIIVTGCMIQKEGSVDIFHKSYRHIAILAGTFAMSLLPHYIEEYKATGRPIVDIEERYDGNELTRQINVPNDYGWHAKININFGCNNFCTYCIVPYVRGRERSRKMQEIIEEAKHLTENGVKEIQLLGQNVNSYGKDLNDSYGFAQLLQELNTIDGLKRIR